MVAPPELIHPLGKSPILEDEGDALVETSAICEYLVAKTGNRDLVTHGEDRLSYEQFLH
jgi:glutathione S-transferase